MSQTLRVTIDDRDVLVDAEQWETTQSVTIRKNGIVWSGRPCDVTWDIHTARHTGYVVAWPGVEFGVRIRLHRLLLNAPVDLSVDHINGNGLDNTLSNLRLATQQQNCQNVRKCSAKRTSQFVGVCFDKRKRQWRAVGAIGGKVIHLGYSASEVEAASIRDAWVKLNRPEFGYLNLESLPAARGVR